MLQLRESPREQRWRWLLEKATELFERYDYHSYDAIIVVPPGAILDQPAIGPHLLSARARQAGFRVAVLYANMIFAKISGEAEHQLLCTTSEQLWGERVFARAAYGSPALGRKPSSTSSVTTLNVPHGKANELSRFRKLSRFADRWAHELSILLANRGPRVIGCSSMFQQNAASIALLKRIKRLVPDCTTIMGGPNCNGEMAAGVLSLCQELDFVFSGEADEAFPEFLRSVSANCLPDRSVISGNPLLDMDSSPAPDYSGYYEQLELFLPSSQVQREGKISLPYETSRGCWWGEKHHCTFCGLNANGMVFRSKSPDRVINDLRALLEQHPNRLVNMVDNIMPHQYFKTLLPRIGHELPNLQVFYEQKSNLSLEKVNALHRAGFTLAQPGIESLSTSLLKKMKKGVTASQNINLLRYCRSVGITLVWNILYGFPGDVESEYESMMSFIPKLQHLNPPSGVFSVCIERFSPYFERPEEFGVSNIRPADVYSTFLPEGADLWKIASQFQADYESDGLRIDSIQARLWQQVIDWHQPWQAAQPSVLELTELGEDTFLLLDTRSLPNVNRISFLNRSQAKLALTGVGSSDAADIALALERGWIIELDGSLQPLVLAEPELLAAFELEVQHLHRRPHLPLVTTL